MSRKDAKELDELLEQTEFLHVPIDFDKKILRSINTLSDKEKAGKGVMSFYWTWLALLGGSLLALSQVSAYIFSVWLTVNAH